MKLKLKQHNHFAFKFQVVVMMMICMMIPLEAFIEFWETGVCVVCCILVDDVFKRKGIGMTDGMVKRKRRPYFYFIFYI